MRTERQLSLSSTRDNFVRHAITAHACPTCKAPIEAGADGAIACKCGFTVGAAEIDRHKEAKGAGNA
jgi:uncharacterized Zn finger protein (UPF0148 family)